LNHYEEIGLKELVIFLWSKTWIIVSSALVLGIVAFYISKFSIEPQYQATIRLYVNNKTESTNMLTTSDVTAAKSLVDTYITIIESNSYLNDVSKMTDFKYTPSEIKNMLSANSINGTEVFEVSVTGAVPKDCAKIANLIAQLAPSKISAIVEGSSVKIIDRAKTPTKPISPNISKNIAIACLFGLFACSFILVLIHIFDTTIYKEIDLKSFCKLPVLGIFIDFDQINRNKPNTRY